jgi:hypothetical protein
MNSDLNPLFFKKMSYFILNGIAVLLCFLTTGRKCTAFEIRRLFNHPDLFK